MLAKWIITHFPEHRVYVEPFGGGGSVLLCKPKSFGEVYNDLDDEVVNVFRVLRDESLSIKLKYQLENTPFSRAEFDLSYEKSEDSEDSVEQARRTIVRSFMGFGSDSISSKYKAGFRANSFSQNRSAPKDWINYPPNIEFFHERFKDVVIENKDAFSLMKQHDRKESLFYVDPPYVHSTRKNVGGYKYELSDEKHEELGELLNSLEGKVILSGYDNPLYQDIFKGWTKRIKNTKADHARDRIETLWISPNIE